MSHTNRLLNILYHCVYNRYIPEYLYMIISILYINERIAHNNINYVSFKREPCIKL